MEDVDILKKELRECREIITHCISFLENCMVHRETQCKYGRILLKDASEKKEGLDRLLAP
jgi:hypothetical protein